MKKILCRQNQILEFCARTECDASSTSNFSGILNPSPTEADPSGTLQTEQFPGRVRPMTKIDPHTTVKKELNVASLAQKFLSRTEI